MIERRSPHQVGKSIAKGINGGQISFFDKHLSMFPTDLVYVSLGGCLLGCGRETREADEHNHRASTPRTGKTQTSMSSLLRRQTSSRTAVSSPVHLSVPPPS